MSYFTVAGEYDDLMGPIYFTAAAKAVADHVGSLLPRVPTRILEVAAGTGQLTRELAASYPAADVTATDISAAMVDFAASRHPRAKVRWSVGDAHDLTSLGTGWDLVASQFGVMFYADRHRALTQARGAAGPAGVYVQTSWDRLLHGDLDEAAARALLPLCPQAASLLAGTIHGYSDRELIAADLAAAGFADVGVDVLEVPVTATGQAVGRALAFGSALQSPIRAAGVDLGVAADAMGAGIGSTFGAGPEDPVETTLRIVVGHGRRAG